ncbi:MAG: DNA adenine methylase [Clostridia bacterium]|nr:DNA adenine methylase [Clostridia bacterium]
MYQGGKSKIARAIASVIVQAGGRCNTFVSLFCGSCAAESKITGFQRMILNDKHEYLISLLQGVQDGYELPETITFEQYQYIRENKDADRVLSGFVGFACSFGGKWFRGYARSNGVRNYAASGKRALLKDMATLKNATFVCGDYRQLPIPPGAVIYADPPYKNTTGYLGEKFDTDEFWAYMRLLARAGHLVFVSEMEAPDDFVCIWQQSVARTLNVNKNNQLKVTEKLFTYKDVTYDEQRLDG